MEYTEQLKDYIRYLSADLVGTTDVAALSGILTSPDDLLNPFSHAISVGVRVPKAVFEMILDRPTPHSFSCGKIYESEPFR